MSDIVGTDSGNLPPKQDTGHPQNITTHVKALSEVSAYALLQKKSEKFLHREQEVDRHGGGPR